MNVLDFSFEQPAWEAAIDALRPGDSLSALRFLALVEGEDEDAVEAAFQALEEKRIYLDITVLPKEAGTGDTALRLRQEEQLVRQGKLPDGLEENDPLRLYLEEIDGLSQGADAEALAQRCQNGDEQAMAALTNAMLPRVVQLAKELTGRGVLLLDLIQEGSLGLWQSIPRFSGSGFAAHADYWIKAYLARCVVAQARQNGVGQKLRQAVENYQTADKRLLTALGRNPTLEEIAQALNMTPEDARAVEKLLGDARAVAKSTQPSGQPEEAEQAVEHTAYFQSRARIGELLSSLDEQSVRLLTLRFGLEGGLPLSPEETGKRLGLTAEEVVEREAAALQNLRENQ